ncbi:MAG: aminopeptidase [Gammaproteobacteria bacterium]|nr:aminopeptidase [Gammaproteobacteria bacterium]
MSKLRLLPIALIALSILGCANFGYYAQAVNGHFDMYLQTRRIDDLLLDPNVDPALKRKLSEVLRIREFASRELGLPDNDSYRAYADLKRPYVIWNVFATPELSMKPKEWCFLVAGCNAYRGYFSEHEAEAFAAKLRAEGFDVHVGGITAYSTLGWFRDPLLNTTINRPLIDIAGLIFHELAHQKYFVAGDTAFSESFAMTVELEGMRRWLQTNASGGEYEKYETRLKRRQEFATLVLKHRDRLEAVYESDLSVAKKRAGKAQVFADLRTEYEQLKASWNGYNGYDGWFADDLNNAHLVSIGMYHRHIPAFQAILARQQGDLNAFYEAVKVLGHLPKTERTAALDAYVPITTVEKSELLPASGQ